MLGLSFAKVRLRFGQWLINAFLLTDDANPSLEIVKLSGCLQATFRIRSRAESDRLTIWFEDSGPGVPQDSLRYLFDRLYRVDKSRSRGLGGSGLGMSICKQIVEIHGGNISAANGPLGGLTITIELPLNRNT